MILAIESSCDETAAALRRQRADGCCRAWSPPRPSSTPYGGVVPEVASRRHLELCVPVVERALDDAGVGFDQHRRRRRHRGPGSDRRAAGRPGHRQGACLRAPPAADPRRPPARSRRVAVPGAEPVAAPFLVLLASVATPCWPRWTTTVRVCGSSGKRSTTPPARHSTRARACSASAIPAAPRSSGWPARAMTTRTSSRSPWPAARASTSPSAGSRPPCAPPFWPPATSRPGAPTWRRPTSARWCARWCRARCGRWR